MLSSLWRVVAAEGSNDATNLTQHSPGLASAIPERAAVCGAGSLALRRREGDDSINASRAQGGAKSGPAKYAPILSTGARRSSVLRFPRSICVSHHSFATAVLHWRASSTTEALRGVRQIGLSRRRFVFRIERLSNHLAPAARTATDRRYLSPVVLYPPRSAHLASVLCRPCAGRHACTLRYRATPPLVLRCRLCAVRRQLGECGSRESTLDLRSPMDGFY